MDRNITITKYQDDKISAEELFNNFKEDQKNTFITIRQFRSSLSDRNIEYNKNLCFGKELKRGGFVGIKYKEEIEEKENDLDHGLDFGTENFKKIIKNKDLEIEKLKKEIEELKKLNIVDDKKPEKNIFTIDELKTKTKTKKHIINVSAENDYKDTELSDLDLSF